jgi:hypothetical protein
MEITPEIVKQLESIRLRENPMQVCDTHTVYEGLPFADVILV